VNTWQIQRLRILDKWNLGMSAKGARHQDEMSDWPSVVTWLWLWLCWNNSWSQNKIRYKVLVQLSSLSNNSPDTIFLPVSFKLWWSQGVCVLLNCDVFTVTTKIHATVLKVHWRLRRHVLSKRWLTPYMTTLCQTTRTLLYAFIYLFIYSCFIQWRCWRLKICIVKRWNN
jgi:hypothetical protein